MIDLIHIYIVIGVVALFLIVLFMTRSLLRRAEAKRSEAVKKQGDTLPIETSSPIDHPRKQALKLALRSIKTRYTVIRHLILIILVLALIGALAFPLLGTIPGTMISALLAMLSVVIGIAARPFLENLVAGVLITISGVVRVADTVIINDQYGVVEDITPTHIIVKLWDWRRYVLPNSSALTRDFINLTLRDPYQWAMIEFWVAPDADLDVVEAEAIAAAKRSDKLADHETPNFWVCEMGKDGIRCWVTAWADSPSDGWQLKHDIRADLARRLREKGVLPHRFNLTFQRPAEHKGGINEHSKEPPRNGSPKM